MKKNIDHEVEMSELFKSFTSIKSDIENEVNSQINEAYTLFWHNKKYLERELTQISRIYEKKWLFAKENIKNVELRIKELVAKQIELQRSIEN